jgi:hypothetical protein
LLLKSIKQCFVHRCLSCSFWSLCCMSFDLRLLITPLVSFGHCVVCPSSIYGFWLPLWYLLVIVLSVLRFTAFDYPFGMFWSLCCLSFDLRLLITPLVCFGHCVVSPSIYGFWLPLFIFRLFFHRLTFENNTYIIYDMVLIPDSYCLGWFYCRPLILNFLFSLARLSILNWPPRYNCSIVESDVQHHNS